MPTRLSVALQNAQAAQLTALLDAGSGAGYMELRTGTQPANPATSATGTLLATVVLEDPAFGAPTAGVATLADPDEVNFVADGTVGWVRFYDSDANAVLDGAVTTTGGGGLVTLNSLTAVTSSPVDITGGTWTQPAS